MGARNTPDQQRVYTEQARERQRKAGLKRRELLAHDDDWPAVKGLADQLRAKRLKASQPDDLDHALVSEIGR